MWDGKFTYIMRDEKRDEGAKWWKIIFVGVWLKVFEDYQNVFKKIPVSEL